MGPTGDDPGRTLPNGSADAVEEAVEAGASVRPAEGRGGRPLIDSLTGVRGLAAIWVTLAHYVIFVHFPPVLSDLATEARAAVSMFFALSGLVLTLNYRRWFTNDTARWRDYARARVARMVPVYLVGIVVATAVTLYALRSQRAGEMVWLRGDIPSAPAAFGVWLLHTFALQAWVPLYSVRDLFNPPDWSVATEAFMYACFPLLMVAFARWIRTARAAICVAAVLLAAQAIFTTVIIAYAFNRWGLREHYQEARLVHYQLPLARLPDFVTGCVLGLLLDRFDFRPVKTRAGRNAIAAAAIIWIALFIQLDNIIGAERGTQTYVLLVNLKMHVAFMPAVAALLFVLSLGPTFLHPLLEHRWVQAIGLASYSIYIIHFPLAQPLLLQSMASDSRPPIWQPAALWVATIALGLAIHHVIEVPARRAILDRRARRSSLAPAS